MNTIAAGHPLTVEAAEEALWLGGNAFDAAVAAVFASMVAEPILTSPGGGGCFLAVPHEKEPRVYDFFVDMPGRKSTSLSLDFFAVDVDFGGAIQEFHFGKAAAAVPGNISGLLHVQATLGVLPLEAVLQPAIQAASHGVTVCSSQAYLFSLLEEILTHDSRGREIFAPNGSVLTEGERIVFGELASFFEELAREGPELVYRGDVASQIVTWAENGGLITAEDLSNYRVFERKPISAVFCDHLVLLNPPPAQSGLLMAATLRVLEEIRCRSKTGISIGQIVRALDATDGSRGSYSMEELQNALDTEELAQRILNQVERLFWNDDSSRSGGNAKGPILGSTTHCSVLDDEGNAASVTSTNGEGCGYIVPGGGFMLNNMLGESDLNPEGFHVYPPGRRLATMMAPTVVLRDGHPVLVTGSSGSNRIRSAVIQVLVNVLHHGLSLEEATAAPRLHVEGRTLSTEPGIDNSSIVALESRYAIERFEGQNLFFGGVNSVTPDACAGDQRRGGAAARFRRPGDKGVPSG